MIIIINTLHSALNRKQKRKKIESVLYMNTKTAKIVATKLYRKYERNYRLIVITRLFPPKINI